MSADKNSGVVYAQEEPTILREFYDDVTYLIREPDFYGVIGGLTLLPVVFDRQFDRESRSLNDRWGNSQFADDFYEFGASLGGQIQIPVSAALYLAFRKSKNETAKRFSSDLLRALIINNLTTVGMKVSIDRTRPDGESLSYPSGHTSTAFTSAGVVYRHFGLKYGIMAYSVATYVGLSRIQENKHYVSDVIVGGIVGTYISMKITGRSREKQTISITPASTGGGFGFILSAEF